MDIIDNVTTEGLQTMLLVNDIGEPIFVLRCITPSGYQALLEDVGSTENEGLQPLFRMLKKHDGRYGR